MMLRCWPVISCGLALMLCGCGATTLDATDDATVKASVERMSAGLSPDQKQEFARSILALSVGPAMRESLKASFGGKPAPPAPSASTTMKPLHGLTVDQINAKAAAYRESLKSGAKAAP